MIIKFNYRLSIWLLFLFSFGTYAAFAQKMYFDAFSVNGNEQYQVSGIQAASTLKFYTKSVGGEFITKRTSSTESLRISRNEIASFPAFVLDDKNNKTSFLKDKWFDVQEMKMTRDDGFNLLIRSYQSITVRVFYGWSQNECTLELTKDIQITEQNVLNINEELAKYDSTDWVFVRYEIMETLSNRLIYNSEVQVINLSHFLIYPTKANSLLNIKVSRNLINQNIQIFNLVGQEVGVYLIADQHVEVDLSTLPRGQYILRFPDKPWLVAEKFIVD